MSEPPEARFDLTEPGWTVRHGQAVWRPSADAEELAGELLVALHSDGRAWLEFAKPPVTLAVARVSGDAWRIELPLRRQVRRGHGSDGAEFAWLQLVRALARRPVAAGWRFAGSTDGEWRLEKTASGERVSGFLLR